jgi:hypothetical protein
MRLLPLAIGLEFLLAQNFAVIAHERKLVAKHPIFESGYDSTEESSTLVAETPALKFRENSPGFDSKPKSKIIELNPPTN